jgi:broad specificity phosphatase PhoE
MARLFFVRHGENVANLTKEFSSRRVDYSLTAKGILQAQQTAEYFSARSIRNIYASPLKRAYETAAIIAAPHLLPLITLQDLSEIDVGDLELQPPTETNWDFHNSVLMDWLQGNVSRTFPGGENQLQLWRRMRRALEQITQDVEDGEAIAVTHGGILFTTIFNFCPGLDPSQLGNINNCSITEILLDHKDGQLSGELVSWARYGHLHGEAANFVSGTPERDTFSGSSEA